MKIEVTGSRCISCYKYSQYYHRNYLGEFEAIDCGYCGIRQCTTRPGNRCKAYKERSNVGILR
ncbi:hypothetical protein GCM10008922_12910 [Faecalicatena contorta]|uniref:Uncharacterized protein n=1 Tax=Hungatella hathewayi TaxID=154046 RepID=A0A3E2WV56_9FIRM|nr:hypothetical protein [Hungatella hathewayi]RGC31514.1 hypothetical protein DWX41_11865 [Hungatella hathewayi]